MERYVTFLRGINVSGQKIIKMETLRAVLTGAGFAEVKTYIQSGNVLFDSPIHDSHLLIHTIENLIAESFGFRTDVILRKYSEIEAMVNSPFFSKIKLDEGTKYYITFLKEKYQEPLVLPLFSKNRDVEIIFQSGADMISVSTLFKGNYGFPNSFIEKLTGIAATTRNPNSLEKILKLR
ncbi:MAG: DUF1697 domain-containing protein [Bacteroidota bacterium]